MSWSQFRSMVFVQNAGSLSISYCRDCVRLRKYVDSECSLAYTEKEVFIVCLVCPVHHLFPKSWTKVRRAIALEHAAIDYMVST